MEDAPTKTDPNLRFTFLKQAEIELLDRLKEKEKELKRQLAELDTLRSMIDEAVKEIEDKQVEEVEKTSERFEQQRQALEEMIADTKEKRRERTGQEQTFEEAYTPITSEKLTQLTQYETMQELYTLEQKEEWSPQDAYTFFEISSLVTETRQYEFSSPIEQSVNKVYETIAEIAKNKQDQIMENYDSTKSTQLEPNTTYKAQNILPDATQNKTPDTLQTSPRTNTARNSLDELTTTYKPDSSQ